MCEKLKKLMQLNGVESIKKPEPAEVAESRIAELEEQNAMLVECLLEISEIIYS